MTTVTIEKIAADDPTALLDWYDGCNKPQPVELCLDLESGELYFRVDSGVGGPGERGTPARHAVGLVQTWEAAPFTPKAANELTEQVRELAQIILDHSTVEWDGSNRVGRLDDQAQEAYDTITGLIIEAREDDDSMINACEAGDYYSDSDVRRMILEDHGITADTTDEELEAAAAKIDAEALDNGFMVVRTEKWLTEERDALRAERD